uniref:ATP synthase peripheral stalk subunit F6, mitochondrial n=1 Tax=Ciona savignyi TaxID=51511 RepID=H2ZDE4_CIOSA
MATRQGMQAVSNFLRYSSSRSLFSRNFGSSAIAFNKLDPIQQVFMDQITKYKQLSAKQGGGPVEAGAEYEQKKKEAIDRLSKMYNVGDPVKFPEFNFTEPNLEQQNINSLGEQ